MGGAPTPSLAIALRGGGTKEASAGFKHRLCQPCSLLRVEAGIEMCVPQAPPNLEGSCMEHVAIGGEVVTLMMTSPSVGRSSAVSKGWKAAPLAVLCDGSR